MEFRKVPPILGVLEVELEASRGGSDVMIGTYTWYVASPTTI